MERDSERRHIAFSFTSHGFGHLSRTLRVLDAFLELHPCVDVTVSCRAPRWLLDRHLRREVRVRDVDFEPGTVQKNCFEVDVDATRSAYARFAAERAQRLEREERFFRGEDVTGLVVDIPALPVRAASELGIPSVGVANFTWDWILEPVLDAAAVAQIRADYASGDLLLSLPFGPGSGPFRELEHAPLVGPGPALPRAEVLQRIGLEPGESRPIVLVCIGGWGADSWEPICVSGCSDLQFVIVGELPIEPHAPTLRLASDVGPGVGVSDLVAAADVVMTKPGYGIASECVTYGVPMVGIERRGFRESGELVRGLTAIGAFRPLALEDFFAGSWERPIRELLALHPTGRARPVDGLGAAAPGRAARRVAVRLGEFFALGPRQAVGRAFLETSSEQRIEADRNDALSPSGTCRVGSDWRNA